MKSKLLIASLILITLLAGLIPARAQEDTLSPEELEWVAFVSAAYDALFALDSLKADTVQEVNQTVLVNTGFADVTVVQTISQHTLAAIQNGEDGFPTEIYSQLDQTSRTETEGVPPQEIALKMEMVYQDGVFLMQVTEAPPDVAGLFPQGWFDPDILSGSGLDFSAMTNLTGREALSIYPLNEDTVLRIKELEQEDLDGQPMRVFEIILDPAITLEAAGMSGLFDPESLGAGGDQFIEDMLAGMNFSQRVWISVEDGLPHRISFKSAMHEIELELQGQAMTMSQITEATVDFFDFNEPVEIPEPAGNF
jgi:hypothetical protein